MALTEAQHAERRKRFYSTDVAALLGCDPWRNGAAVIAEKVYDMEPVPSKPYMDAGTRFENVVLDWGAEQVGAIIRNQHRVCKNHALGTHIDAIVQAPQEPMEGKTAGLFGPLVEEWGADGSDEVPERVVIQDIVHMVCMGCTTVCHTPAFIGGRGFLMYHIPWDEETAAGICEAADWCWEEYVVNRKPYPDQPPALEVLKRIKRVPNKIVPVSVALVEAKEAATEARKAAETTEEEAKATLISTLGDADAGSLPDGRMVTYYRQSHISTDVKRLRAEKPEVAQEYQRASTFPVLRIKNPPKPKRRKT